MKDMKHLENFERFKLNESKYVDLNELEFDEDLQDDLEGKKINFIYQGVPMKGIFKRYDSDEEAISVYPIDGKSKIALGFSIYSIENLEVE